MKRVTGPINPVTPHANGFPGYSMNPLENLPVAESQFAEHNIADDYYTEPVFSQALYGFDKQHESYDSVKRRD